jgi:prefoldin subunit 5
MQEMRLNAQRIDEAIEDLEDHKKILEHNLSVAEESIKALYNVIDGKNNSNEFSTQEV